MSVQPFHLAIPVYDLERARRFYTELLGCTQERSSQEWIDLNFFGHQLVLHLSHQQQSEHQHNVVDGSAVPISHFGVVLPWDEWHRQKDQLVNGKINFLIKPYNRFEGQPSEQATMFFMDTESNALEFKSFKDISQLFAT